MGYQLVNSHEFMYDITRKRICTLRKEEEFPFVPHGIKYTNICNL